MKDRITELSLANTLCNVAGVTFENRQDILQNLYMQNPWRFMNLIYTQYQGDPAIAVQDYLTKQVIGYIPREKVETYAGADYPYLTGLIRFNNVFYCSLYAPVSPSAEEYNSVIKICSETGRQLPIYDARAYLDLIFDSDSRWP